MSTSTIEMTDGITERTSRIALKRAMSAFGEVDACHMGDRAVMGDRFTEFPIVRFKMQSSAEAALQAIKSGQVFLDGLQLQGEWRGGGGLAVRQRLKAPQGRPPIAPQPEEDTSSRMLLDMPANSQRPSLDGHNTFTGRDQRREDREGYSSRRLFDAPANFSGGRTEPKRSRSRRRRRSPSRNRKESRSRSRSGKKAGRGVGGGSAASLAALLGFKVMKPHDELSLGNLESAVSDNPLYVGRR